MTKPFKAPSTCRSGLVSRKGCSAAPAIHAPLLKSRGRFAALSRHKAAPTGMRASRPICVRQ
ncbi:hypothetical protein CXG50_17735 [Pseudomonas plecoglossicida]|uniref:DUF1534 domain-containing protein n=1 Tax=Pseudomonas plecoglossicida TaxID=70775 RepID=A0ABX4U4Q1_PSEDL|nr:hypothetical protein CSW00_21215 [Pseudomonas sp. MR 02]PLP90417.1 hypothetical protein CX682_15640 [Pseudomonas sp. FFUP_PS_41]PLU85438.1 hypothetical protein CXG44_21005 [Pseudomonas plecoglossicida]QKK98060.1 hypothetical protein GEV38_19765 [Pseudomonas sp. 13159349]TXI06157.1 MAG: hypothetical protein E6Q70_08950 [Pseudomonas monteilii]